MHTINDINLQKILNKLDIRNLDKLKISISTMTIYCKLNIIFDVYNIVHYSKLKKYITNTTKTNIFFNQVSVKLPVNNKHKPISVKIFTNGSIHMTGCKTIQNAIDVLDKIFKLNMMRAIVQNGHIVDKSFMLTKDNSIIDDNFNVVIKKIKIAMINCNFSIPFNIDRLCLYEILKKNKIDCSFDTIIHAGVIIRYKYPNKDKIVTILVFEKGKIIITGANSEKQIISAYNFIYKYLLNNFQQITNYKKNLYLNMLKEFI